LEGNLVETFALGRFATPEGRRFTGVVRGETVLELGRDMRSLLEAWDNAVPELAAADGAQHDLATLTVLPPVEPRQIFQSGANYRTHVIDLVVAHRPADDPRSEEEARAEAAAMMDRRAAEDLPYVFTGLPSAITGPYDDVILPEWTAKADWELELAAVIGRPAYRVSADEALDHVAGYTIANDVTARDAVFRRDMPEIGTDWFRSKNAPTFLPLGPYLVPRRFIADPGDLRITLKLNGQVMQDETTKAMIFDVARLVSYISQSSRLLPGDIVLTGSPAGNGLAWGRLLRDGDIMEGSITGLGTQRNLCRAER
jgi:2-keto-4-pentenoate hydratase/2-oxohepta-3-ene-1,7-dioic acid hydratase in catechol pathway